MTCLQVLHYYYPLLRHYLHTPTQCYAHCNHQETNSSGLRLQSVLSNKFKLPGVSQSHGKSNTILTHWYVYVNCLHTVYGDGTELP